MTANLTIAFFCSAAILVGTDSTTRIIFCFPRGLSASFLLLWWRYRNGVYENCDDIRDILIQNDMALETLTSCAPCWAALILPGVPFLCSNIRHCCIIYDISSYNITFMTCINSFYFDRVPVCLSWIVCEIWRDYELAQFRQPWRAALTGIFWAAWFRHGFFGVAVSVFLFG